MTLEDWKRIFCECGHSRYDHEDEHDEVPTGTGRCLKGCTCDNFRRNDWDYVQTPFLDIDQAKRYIDSCTKIDNKPTRELKAVLGT